MSPPISPPASGAPSVGAESAEQSRWFKDELQPHEGALRAYLHRKFPAMQEVDDVVQDSFLHLLQQRPAGKIATPKAYLFAVARHAVFKLFRQRRIYSAVPVNELPEWRLLDGGPDALEAVDLAEQHALVARAIVRLPGRCREILMLRAVQGLAYAEIGAQLGLSEATVRVQTARGIRKCAQYLRDHDR